MKSRGASIQYSIIQDAFELLLSHAVLRPKLQGKWLSARTFIDAMKEARYFSDEHKVAVDVKKFNSAMTKSNKWGMAMRCFDGTNGTGIWQVSYNHRPFYMIGMPGLQVEYPAKLDLVWYQEVCCNEIGILQRSRSATEAGLLQHNEDTITIQQLSVVIDVNGEAPSRQQNSSEETVVTAAFAVSQERRPSGVYWDSTEAKKLFGARPDDENALVTLERKIEKLKAGNQTVEGYRNLIFGRDPGDECTAYQVYEVRQKSALLCTAYIFARDQMGNKVKWESCCQQSCSYLNICGIEQTTDWQVLKRWNIAFRTKEYFNHPNPHVATGKLPQPLFLEAFPFIKRHIRDFCLSDLANMSIDKVRNYVLCDAIPYCMMKDSITDDEKESFLKRYGLRTMSQSTIYCWMTSILGFSYCDRKKTYYVDGHEREDVVLYRNEFCKRYLTVYEPRCMRWLQLPKAVACQYPELKDSGGGYEYNKDNIMMCEYHIDAVPDDDNVKQNNGTNILEKLIANGYAPTMSVRSSPNDRPLMIIGQDECVFSQFLLRSKMWTGPDKEGPLLPKSDGEGRMISAMQSRDFGFGLPMSASQLAQVNVAHANQPYIDKAAAMEVYRNTIKPPLTMTPFLRTITIGVNNDGYWTSYHMAIQLEDCVDCLKILFPDFDFLFLFDHSQGHSKKRIGSLQASHLNLKFGGAQHNLRDTEITAGCLGPFSPSLRIGDIQRMVFESTDDGPFYLNQQERLERRHDRDTGVVSIDKPKNMTQLMDELKRTHNVVFPLGKQPKKSELHDIAQQHGVSLTENKAIIEEGWVGKSKGILQILQERGLIDDSNYKLMTVDGKKDPDSEGILQGSSLRALLDDCCDFKNELSALQLLGQEIGITVDATPKYHAELAGEGIEYSWGYSKGVYRRAPLSRKKGRKNFFELVEECCNPAIHLTKERVRKMAKRARSYICTYHYMAQQMNERDNPLAVEANQHQPQNENILAQQQKLLFVNIEKLTKQFRTHHCALDFDGNFVTSFLKMKICDNASH